MDTSKLKRFATEARNILIQGVKQRLSALGFTDKGTATEEPQLFEGGATFMGEVVSTDFYHKWMSLQQAVSQRGIKVVEEEAAYTWFNRLVAIRIMVKNGIIAPVLEYESEDSRIPLLVSEARQGRTPSMDERTQELWNGMANDDSKTNEQFALLIVAFCHATPIINKCFGHIADYTELLLPVNILAEGGFVDMMNHTDYISEADYQSPELIGWLYQFYISQRKDEVMAKKGKYTADEIPAATQIFTPNWIVKYMVQNTVGRIYLDNNEYADDLKESWKYLVGGPAFLPDNNEQQDNHTRQADTVRQECRTSYDDLADLKVADLACGSGHILNEAFDLLFQLYTYEGYSRTNAIEQIFKRNLTGIDLDTRAKQLATFALLLKACQKDSSFADAHCLPCVYDMPVPFCQSIGKTYSDSKEETEIIRPYVREFIMADNKEIENEIIDAIILMDEAQTLGSIMKFNISDEARHALEGSAFLPNNNSGCIKSAAGMPHLLLPYIEIILALTEKYAALVMNPPYMGSGSMNGVLSKYVKENYKDGKADMFSVFMLLANDRLAANGKYGMINMQSWMFLSSFESLRKTLLDKLQIDSLLHLGPRTFDELSGEVVQNVAFVISKHAPAFGGTYYRLVDGRDCRDKECMFLQNKNGNKEDGNHIYYPNVSQKNFEKIPGCPIGYWVSEKVMMSFSNLDLHESCVTRCGMATGNNDVYLRLWQEVSYKNIGFNCVSRKSSILSKKRWFPYDKAGEYRKWFGNRDYLVDWFNDGNTLQTKLHPDGKRIWAHNFNIDKIFQKHIGWSDIISGEGGLSFRYFENGFLFDGSANAVFEKEGFDDDDFLIIEAYSNSCISEFVRPLLNPTIHFKPGNFLNLPYHHIKDMTISEIARQNISLSKEDWDFHETSWDFEENPLVAIAKGGAAFLPHNNNKDNEIEVNNNGKNTSGGNATAVRQEGDDDRKDINVVRQECRTSYLNKKEYVHITKGHKLPHWYQQGKTQFVTFRLADSLPQSKMEEYRLLKEQWTKEHPQPWTKTEQEEYDKLIGARLNKWLDDGLGSCVLKRDDARKCLEEALAFYDGREYFIHAYVIMPNHVHILLTPIGNTNVVDILGRVKGYSAKKINQTIGSSGELWQKDMFDRMVRSDENFNSIIEYIRTNPTNLPDGSYSLGGAAFLPHNKERDEIEEDSVMGDIFGDKTGVVRQDNEDVRIVRQECRTSYRIEELYEQYEEIWTEKFMQLHANEEELNRRFIDIYGLQDELTPDVPLSEVTILQQGEISIEKEDAL